MLMTTSLELFSHSYEQSTYTRNRVVCGLIGEVCSRASRSKDWPWPWRQAQLLLLLCQLWESSVWAVQDLVLVHTRLGTFWWPGE